MISIAIIAQCMVVKLQVTCKFSIKTRNDAKLTLKCCDDTYHNQVDQMVIQ